MVLLDDFLLFSELALTKGDIPNFSALLLSWWFFVTISSLNKLNTSTRKIEGSRVSIFIDKLTIKMKSPKLL
ncbi:MAG: hypothetical protein CME70_03040 [Halobacteriovorax sp.]|nr:hypothetical protein [Halobacteriovorax sp.]